MTRSKWTVLGLAALALVAMSAFVANGAQGESTTPEFTCLDRVEDKEHEGCTATGVPVELHREHDGGHPSNHQFDTAFGPITCTSIGNHFTTDADGTNATPEAEPTFNDCQANPGHNQAHVDTNGCHFQYHPEKTSGETKAEDEYVGTASIVGCDNAGKSMTITVTNNTFTDPTNTDGTIKCLIHIPEQTGIGPVYFRTHTNVEEGELTDMTIEFDTADITGESTGGFFNCGVFGEHSVLEYTGNTTVQAENHDAKPINLELD